MTIRRVETAPSFTVSYQRPLFLLAALWFVLTLTAQPQVSGALNWIHTLEGVQMTGLAGAIDVALSPDGRSLYTVSTVDDALVVFRRDLVSGALSHRRTHAVTELLGAAAVVVAPDGESVYVAGILADAVSHWSRDPVDGALTFVGSAPSPTSGGALGGPSALAFGPGADHLWAVGLQDGRVVRWARVAGGALAFDGAWDLGFAGARDLAVSADGSRIYVTDLLSDSLVVAEVGGAGVSRLQTLTQGFGGIDGLDGAYLTELAPGGAHLYVTALDGHTVAHFDVLGDGSLALQEVHQDGVAGVTGLNGALGLGLSEDRQRLFVTGSLSDALATFERDQTSGDLQFLSSVDRQDIPGAGLDGAAGLVVRGGTLTLAASSHPALAVFDVGSGASPRHVHTSRHPSFVGGPNLAVALPDEPLVYVLSLDSCSGGQCVRYAPTRRDSVTGALTSPDFRAEVNALSLTVLTALTLSPDGGQIYVLSHNEQALVVLEKEPAGDELQLVQILIDGVGGVEGLQNPESVVVSPDGAHAYVAAGQSLSRFARDLVSGSLTYLGLTEPASSVNPESIAFSPNGRFLYLLGFSGDIVAYDRDPVSGDLQEIDSEFVSGNPQQGVVSSDGRHLYVTVNNLGFMIAYELDPATGVVLGQNQFLSVPGLLQPRALTRVGETLYVADRDDARIVSLHRDPASGLVSFSGIVGDLEELGFLEAPRIQASADGRHLYVSSRGNRVVVLDTGNLFEDGFESGNTAAWSSSSP